MAQDISGTELATSAAATTRNVKYRVMVDFGDVGFSTSLVGWTDISAYVKRLQGDHQATDWRKSPGVVGSGVSDEVTVQLQNPEETSPYTGLRYSSSNTASSLYSQIGDGKINMKRCVVEMGFENSKGATERLRQITGYITGVDEGRQGRNISFTVRDRAADATQTRKSSTLDTDTTAYAQMTKLAAALEKDPLTSIGCVFDRGMVILPYAWLDDDSVWDEMSTIAESQLGRVWFDKDGLLHFDDGTHFVKPSSNSFDDATVSQFSFTTGNMRSVDAKYNMGSIFNHIVVEYQPRYVATHQVIYSATETTIIPPSSYRDVRCEFRYPVYSVWFTDTQLVVDTGAVTAGGTDIDDDVSYTLTTRATFANIRLTNANENFAAYVYRLDIKGCPLLSEQANKYEAEDTTSIARYGRRTWRVNNPYIMNYRHAEMIGDYLLARYKDPLQVIRIAGARGVPWLEPGDRVTVTDSLSGISGEYFITHLRWSFASGSPYTMDITAMRAADLFTYLDQYFILGTSMYGQPSNPSVTLGSYGRMFW